MARWVLLGLIAPTLAWASPVQLQHAGRLLDQDGTPIEAETVLQLSVYASPTGGSPVWTEDLSVDPVGGFYAVVLGADTSGNPLDSSAFDGTERFLQIGRVEVGGPVTVLGSRQRLGTVPHAVHALLADAAATADTALTADYAATAGAADTALAAETALFASEAATASSATTADTALTADYAATAGAADTALAAETALFASEAATASSATTADTATTADYATAAGSADTATTADSAATADFATQADTALAAETALFASEAGTASSASVADTALSADSATEADNALALGGRSLGAVEAQARSNGNLNVNPCFQQGFDHYTYHAGAGTVVSSSSSMCGTTVFENAANTSTWIRSSGLIPLDRAGTYEVSGSFRRTDTTGTSGSYFLAVALFDASGVRIGGDGTWWYYPVSSAVPTDTNWNSHAALFGAGTDHPFPAAASFMSVGAILNYNGTSGGRTYRVTGLGIQRMAGPGTWNTPSYESGWGNYGSSYGPPGYSRDASGVVHLRGLISGGTTTGGVTAFTLPEGYRPPGRRLFVCQTDSPVSGDPGDLARCDVLPDGRVLLYEATSAWVSLDGISFPTW